MKKLLPLFLFVLLPFVASAYDAEIDGIYYNFSGYTAIVTSGDTKYSGNVEIPASVSYNGMSFGVTAIGDRAFYSCNELTSVTIPSCVTSIGKHAFYFCGNLQSFVMPNSVTFLGDYAFYVCQNLSSVTLSEKLTGIGAGTFMMCTKLTSITIPSSVTRIGENAFLECSSLTSLVSKIRTPFAFGSDAFYNVSSQCQLTVPRGKRNAYLEAGWTESLFKGGVVEEEGISPLISFVDDEVKSICVAKWDTDGDGELSMDEAADVTDLDGAFTGNTQVKSFNEFRFFTSLTSLEVRAFNECSNLETIAIPSSLKSFGADAFEGCYHLQRVIIMDLAAWCGISLENPQSNPFYRSSSNFCMYKDENEEEYEEEYDEENDEEFLEDGLVLVLIHNLVIPLGVTKINTGVFSHCTFNSVTIPESVVTIDRFAFDSSDIKSLNIKNGVTTIGERAFSNCYTLNSLTIPNSVTTIGDSAFLSNRCASITFGTGITTIGEFAFDNSDELTSLTIPSNVVSIGKGAFNNCQKLTSIEVAAGNANYDSRGNCNAIIETSTNTLIAGCVNTVVPDDVTSIGYGAFENCPLTSFNLPNSVTSIDEYAFTYCNGLKVVSLPDNLTKLGNYAFGYCLGLTSVTFPPSLTEIGFSAFHYCEKLKSVTLPENLVKLEQYAFASCSSLTSVVIPEDVTEIEAFAFHECQNLAYVVSKSRNPVSFGRYAFEKISPNCVLIVPNGMTSDYARKDWDEYVFKGGVIEEGDSPFILFADAEVKDVCVAKWDTDGDNMLSMEEAAQVRSLGTTFSRNTAITSFDELQYFTGLTEISRDAFYGCTNLASVTIGSGVSSIASFAFGNCTRLQDVTVLAEAVPVTPADAFYGVPIETATLYVPAASYNSYRKTEPWSRFGTIMTLEGLILEVKKCATPTISYAGGVLKFDCETEDVKFHYNIQDPDIKSGIGMDVPLTVTYSISVYASKDDYDNSETAFATLCWIDAEPYMEGLTDEDGVAEVNAVPVLIQSVGGIITVLGTVEGTPIAVYGIDGKTYGSAISEKDRTTIATALQPGSIAVVKIGEKGVKVLVK